jgi:hypothetical protein
LKRRVAALIEGREAVRGNEGSGYWRGRCGR